MESTRGSARPGSGWDRAFFAALAIGLVVRVGLLWFTKDLGLEIVDEQHYTRLANNLLDGHGYAWSPGEPTSIRPPLYPGLLAAVFGVAGANNLVAVRAVQMVLALLTAMLVYRLGRRAFNVDVARLATVAVWLYPTLMLFSVTILTETLFTFLLVLFLLLAVNLVQQPGSRVALLCGLALGATTLTRSALWPLPIVLCPLLALLIRAPLRTRIALPALVFAGYAAVVTPWAIRNTRLQGTLTIVDTMGGYNLRMGNYEHTPDDRMWDAVSITGEKGWSDALTQEQPGRHLSDGQKEKWAQQKAVDYILANPGIFLRRAFIKFADLWGIEREFMAGIEKRMYDPPRWAAVLVSAAIVGAYLCVAIAGAAGIWLSSPERRVHLLLLLPVVAITAAHTIVFGHSRYHLPLIPILALYASSFVIARRHAMPRAVQFARIGAAVTIIALVSVWVRQLVFVDSERIREWLGHVG